MAETTPVSCPAVLDIAAVQAFHGPLREALDKSGGLTLQCDALERIDTAGLQLLAACCQEAADRNLTVTWQGVGDILIEAAKRLDLDGLLNLPESPTS